MKKRLICLLAILSLILPGAARGETALYCLNAGKADALILLTDAGAYLIDAGYEHTWAALRTAFDQLGIRELEGVFLTHCHKDHSGGILPLAQSGFPVAQWYASAVDYSINPEDHPIREAAALYGTEPEWLEAGQVIAVGNDSSFTVIGPLRANEDNENNNSLVMVFSSPDGSILLTGDMKLEEEEDLLNAGLVPSCEVLKCAHHGDNNATSARLLAAVRPLTAVISTHSAEEPDTPAGSTLKRLAAAGCEVWVTQDVSDALILTLEGGQVRAASVRWEGIPALPQLQARIDPEKDLLLLTYRGPEDTLNLSGCTLYSTRGSDTFQLPDLTLKKGMAFVIGSKASPKGEADLTLDVKRVWHKSRLDAAVLVDAWGRGIVRCNNGMEE